jgi:hypothetical protein
MRSVPYRALSWAAAAWVGLVSVPGRAQTSGGESARSAETRALSTVEGRVVHAFTGEPVRRARVSLRREGRESITFVLITGGDGRFAFENLEPGTYSLWSERDGFLAQFYGARKAGGQGIPITVSAGLHLRDLELKLTPQGVISGRVVDDEGEPVPRAYVHAERAETGWALSFERTNDLGEFRIAGLAPGRYRLRAHVVPSFSADKVVVLQKPQARELEFFPTYYPSTTDPSSAVTIELAAGQQVPGITIQLCKGRVYRIEGQVLGISAEQPADSLRVMLMPRSWEERARSLPEAPVESTGEFLLNGVPSGAYYLAVRVRHGPQLLGKTPVEVTEEDLQGVVVLIEPLVTVAGVVRVEGEAERIWGGPM